MPCTRGHRCGLCWGAFATTRVSNAVNRIVYQAVNEAIDSGQIAYEQLGQLRKGQRGPHHHCGAQQHGGLLTGCNPRSWI
ncbi:MAG: hypothetical protein ACLU38_03830 [Dysosmobacter sp.]